MDSVALLAAAVSMTPAYRLNLPPLAEVATGGYLPIASVVKPTSAEDLYDWCVRNGQPDVDSSWASVWPAAAALANLLAREPDLVRGRSVVELGAGLGVAGLSAAQAGASSVTLVDREPLALHCAMSTAECCELQGEDESTPIVNAVAADWAAVAEGLRVRHRVPVRPERCWLARRVRRAAAGRQWDTPAERPGKGSRSGLSRGRADGTARSGRHRC